VTGYYFDNAAIWNVWVDYVGTTETISVSLSQSADKPSQPQISLSVSIYSVLNQATMYLGLGAGSGSLRSIQQVAAWTFSLNETPQFQLGWSLTPPLINNPDLTLSLTGNALLNTGNTGNNVILTNGLTNELSGVFYNVPFTYYQNGVTLSFGAFFTFKISCVSSTDCADGITFIVSSFLYSFL